MKKLLFVVMLLAMCIPTWASDYLWFCGQLLASSTTSVQNECIKSGTVSVDLENSTFVVDNAVIEYTGSDAVFSDGNYGFPTTIKFKGTNRITCSNGSLAKFGAQVVIEGNSLTDKIEASCGNAVICSFYTALIRNCNFSGTTTNAFFIDANPYNATYYNVLSFDNCRAYLSAKNNIGNRLHGITLNKCYYSSVQDLSTFKCENGRIKNNGSDVPSLSIAPTTDNMEITFADSEVKNLCVANWDTNKDGKFTYGEAAAVTTLGAVFTNKSNITRFNELQYFTGLTSISEVAFYSTKTLAQITLPVTVTAIDRSAFRGTTDLKTVLLPAHSKLATVGAYAFDGSGINAFAWPMSLKKINGYGFCDCSNLKVFLASDQLTEIGARAFQNCSSMTNFSMPSSVTSIDDYAFNGCKYYSGTLNLGTTGGSLKLGKEVFASTNITKIRILPKDINKLSVNAGFLTGTTPDLKCYVNHNSYIPLRDVAKTAWTSENADKLDIFSMHDNDTYYSGFVFDQEVKFKRANTTAYIVTNYRVDNNRINLYYVQLEDNVIPANTPVLINCSISDRIIEYEVNPSNSHAPVGVVNYLKGITKNTYLTAPASDDITWFKRVISYDQTFVPLSSQSSANYVLSGDVYLEIPEKVPATVSYCLMTSKDPTGGKPIGKNGDVNGDGIVNVSDVTALVNKILGEAEYSDAVCDINGDGVVNVSDVTALVNIILGEN